MLVSLCVRGAVLRSVCRCSRNRVPARVRLSRTALKRLVLGPLYYEYSREVEPRLRIEPGETVLVETEDTFSGQIQADGDRRDRNLVPHGNPQTGPIWIEGAEVDDVLKITIEDIRPRTGQCATHVFKAGRLAEMLGSEVRYNSHVCLIRDGMIHWNDEISIPYAPMLGCIGTSPAMGAPTTFPAGVHGGNMDIVETCPGNSVYLPVFVPGGLLYLGDAHAAMGHGELSGTALEMPSDTIITVELESETRIPGPRIESPTEIMTIATGTPAEQSIAEAYALLIQWMETDYGWQRWQAFELLTQVGRLSIGYYLNGTVAAKIEKRYLN